MQGLQLRNFFVFGQTGAGNNSAKGQTGAGKHWAKGGITPRVLNSLLGIGCCPQGGGGLRLLVMLPVAPLFGQTGAGNNQAKRALHRECLIFDFVFFWGGRGHAGRCGARAPRPRRHRTRRLWGAATHPQRTAQWCAQEDKQPPDSQGRENCGRPPDLDVPEYAGLRGCS